MSTPALTWQPARYPGFTVGDLADEYCFHVMCRATEYWGDLKLLTDMPSKELFRSVLVMDLCLDDMHYWLQRLRFARVPPQIMDQLQECWQRVIAYGLQVQAVDPVFQTLPDVTRWQKVFR